MGLKHCPAATQPVMPYLCKDKTDLGQLANGQVVHCCNPHASRAFRRQNTSFATVWMALTYSGMNLCHSTCFDQGSHLTSWRIAPSWRIGETNLTWHLLH